MNTPVWTRRLDFDEHKWIDHRICPKCDTWINVECKWKGTVFTATLVSWCGCYTEEQYQDLVRHYTRVVERMAETLPKRKAGGE